MLYQIQFDMLKTPMIRVLLHRSSKVLQHRPFYFEENCIQAIIPLFFRHYLSIREGYPREAGEHFHIGPVGDVPIVRVYIFSKSSRTGNSKAYDFTEHVKFILKALLIVMSVS